jgi:hypothetical protein
MRELHARPAILIAHVNMRDGGACLGRLDASRSDLQRRARQAGMLLERSLVPGDGDRENGFPGHALVCSCQTVPPEMKYTTSVGIMQRPCANTS